MSKKFHTVSEADVAAMAKYAGKPVPDALKAKIFTKVRDIEKSKATPDKSKGQSKGKERG